MLGDTEEVREYGEGAYPHDWYASLRRLSWGAIFAGLFVALAVFITLQMLGAGIGLSSISLTGGETTSASSLGIGAAIWSFIIGLIALFIGGWVAGRLAVQPNRTERVLHGLTVWGLFYVVMFWVVTTALSSLAGGGLSLIGKSASATGQAASSSPQIQQMIQQEIASLTGTGASQPGQTQQGQPGQEGQPAQQGGAGNLASAFGSYIQSDKTSQDRQQLAQAISSQTGKSQAEANQMVNNFDQKLQQAKETTEQAANITGGTFIGLAIAMILDAIAAMIGGGIAAAPVPPHTYRRTTGTKTETPTYASR